MKNGDMPIAPNNLRAKKIGMAGGRYDGAYVEEYEKMGGLTKRECFAVMAMQGILSSKFVADFSTKPPSEMPDGVAEASVDYADALLKALEENE